jgi:hypothetical protein
VYTKYGVRIRHVQICADHSVLVTQHQATSGIKLLSGHLGSNSCLAGWFAGLGPNAIVELPLTIPSTIWCGGTLTDWGCFDCNKARDQRWWQHGDIYGPIDPARTGTSISNPLGDSRVFLSEVNVLPTETRPRERDAGQVLVSRSPATRLRTSSCSSNIFRRR